MIITNTIKPNEPEEPRESEEPQTPKPSKPVTDKLTKSGGHKADDLIQTGTDINFLIPIGFILMLIRVAFIYKKKGKPIKQYLEMAKLNKV